jgi:peptidyl-dipeptidase A
MEQKFQEFLQAHLAKVKPLAKELYLIQWQYDTTGDEKLAERKKQLEEEYVKLYLDEKKFKQLKEFKKSGQIKDPILQRQLDILLSVFRVHVGDKDHLAEMVAIETEVNSIYNHFRGQLDGQALNNNQLKHILQHETDNARRQKAWEASKAVGGQVADKVLRLVRMRNESARKSGFSDYYAMSLACRELDEKKMFATLARLEKLTAKPFREFKRKLDRQQAKKFGVKPEEMYPWHYADFFFQEMPPSSIDLDTFFAKSDLIALTKKTYQSIGMEIEDLLARSNLYPQEGKCQHAYCSMLDRDIKDIRVLANIEPCEYWTGTMLHEFGHAVYDKYIDDNLPYFLRTPAHTLSTEAMAMMMDSLSKNEKWLEEIVERPTDEIRKVEKELTLQERMAQLIFARWGLVMVNFERDMYRNPDQDLNTLWWDYVEMFQYVNRPPDRHAPDWAAKIHLAMSPVYYQNYLYGQMVASQLYHYIRQHVGNGKLFNNPELGKYLIERYFRSGSRYDWNTTLQNATNESLNPEYYITETMGIQIK